ncbi:MAG: GntR family transcriptional regulator [Victivallales bacterium]|nr:GntR family transcriptional regulator [Victivallales bacterium]
MLSSLNQESPIPLYLQLRDVLRQQILSGDASDFLPKEVELCKIYGVSRRTVSRAMALLAESGLVRRVKSKGTLICRNTETASNGHMGLVFPVTSGWKATLQTMQQNATKQGRSLIIFPYEWFNFADEQKAILIAKNSCDGVIIYPNGNESDRNYIAEMSKIGYPLVMFDIYYEDCDCSCVGMDHYLCAYRLTKALIKTPNDRIGIVQCLNEQSHISDLEREKGFIHALASEHINYNKSFELKLYSFDWDKNTMLISKFVKKNKLDGVFITDQNSYPWGEIEKLKMPDLRVSTIGMHPNYSRLRNVNYAEQPEDEIGRLTVQLLHEKINDPSTPAKRIMVSPRYHWNI